MGVAVDDMIYRYQHCINKESKYIVCQYFEKVKEKRGVVQYKLLQDDVYIHPYQVAVPSVTMSENNCLTISEYQFIADCV